MALPELIGAREVVPAEAVEALVAATRFELALLADGVQRAEAEADDLERLVGDAPVATGDELAIFDRLSGWFAQQAEDLDARRRQLVEAGRAQADARLQRARDEAALIRLDGPDVALPDAPATSLLTVESLPPAPEVPTVLDLSDPAPVVDEVEPTPEALLAPEVADAIDPVAVADVVEAEATTDGEPAPEVTLTPDDLALLEGVDLTDLPELLPVLEAMIRAETPPTGTPVVIAAPQAADVAADAPGPAPEPPTASGVQPDAAERFDTFWNAPEPPAPEKRKGPLSVIPFRALLPMVAILVVLVVLLALVG